MKISESRRMWRVTFTEEEGERCWSYEIEANALTGGRVIVVCAWSYHCQQELPEVDFLNPQVEEILSDTRF